MSSCQCYQIGGPWITSDPDCPVHGSEAQKEKDQRRNTIKGLLERTQRAENFEELRQVIIDMLHSLDA